MAKIFRIRNTKTGLIEGVYSRSCRDIFDFESALSAINSNCHGLYRTADYCIEEWEVTETVTNPNVFSTETDD